MKLKSATALAGAMLLVGCVHAPLNRPLLANSDAAAPLPALGGSEAGDNDLMVALFFSGGGTRAACLSYGVLKGLAATEVNTPTAKYRLLDKVRVISAVSGGSFTAAYYCLYHDRIFTDFEDGFLKRNVTAGLLGKAIDPLYWPSLLSPYYGRSDLAAEYYDQTLFHGATFADLGPNNGNPRLILNATDMANGEQFPFVPEHFDLIASDLRAYPISRAVAAASAFPLLLSPVTLKNYRGTPGAVDPDLLLRATADNSQRDMLARNTFRSYADFRDHPYIHLVDGAASDNLGLEALIDADMEFGGMEHLMEQTLHVPPPRRFVVIVVNASVHHHVRWSGTPAVPGVTSELWRLADDFGEHTDAEFLDLLKVALDRWKKDSAARFTTSGVRPEYYLISVDFDKFQGTPAGDFFESLPTNFHLSGSTVDRVVGAGETLLKESPEYRRLLADLESPP